MVGVQCPFEIMYWLGSSAANMIPFADFCRGNAIQSCPLNNLCVFFFRILLKNIYPKSYLKRS